MGDQLRAQMQQLLAAFAQLSERTEALEKAKAELEEKVEEQRAELDAEREMLVLAKDPAAFALAEQLPPGTRLHCPSWAGDECRNPALKVSGGGYRVASNGAKTHGIARAASGVTEGVHCFAVRVENVGSHAYVFVGWCDAQLDVSASTYTGHNGALGASFYMFNGCYYHGPNHGHYEEPAGGGVGPVQRPATIAALLDLDAGRMTVYVDGTALAPCAYAFPKDREWFPHVSLCQGGSLVSLNLEAAVAAARGAPA